MSGGSHLHKVFSGEEWEADMLHQVSQVFLAYVFIVVDPSDHGLENLDGTKGDHQDGEDTM